MLGYAVIAVDLEDIFMLPAWHCFYFIAFWYCEVEGNVSTFSLFVTPDISGCIADGNTSLMNVCWGARALEKI